MHPPVHPDGRLRPFAGARVPGLHRADPVAHRRGGAGSLGGTGADRPDDHHQVRPHRHLGGRGRTALRRLRGGREHRERRQRPPADLLGRLVHPSPVEDVPRSVEPGEGRRAGEPVRGAGTVRVRGGSALRLLDHGSGQEPAARLGGGASTVDPHGPRAVDVGAVPADEPTGALAAAAGRLVRLTATSMAIFGMATTLYMPDLIDQYTGQFGLFGVTIAIIGWLLGAAVITVASTAIAAEFDRSRAPWAMHVKERWRLQDPRLPSPGPSTDEAPGLTGADLLLLGRVLVNWLVTATAVWVATACGSRDQRPRRCADLSVGVPALRPGQRTARPLAGPVRSRRDAGRGSGSSRSQ